MTGCVWRWRFAHTKRYTSARIECTCGWRTTVLRIKWSRQDARQRAADDMESWEVLGWGHSPHRAWDEWENLSEPVEG